MKCRDIIIQNQITGEKEVLKDICNYKDEIKCAMIADRIDYYLSANIPIFIDFGYMR